MTAIGRAISTAADDAAVRSLLSISDIGDLRNYAISRAIQLAGVSRPRVWHGDPWPTPATAASVWATKIGAGTVTRVSTGADCGAFDVAATAGGNYALIGRTEGSSYVDQLVPDVIGTRWYACYLFKCNTGAAATSDMGFGMQGKDSTYTEFVVLGVNGAVSLTKFCLQRFSSSSVLSSVSIDTNWHLGETWSNPDTDVDAVFGAVDGENPIKLDGIAGFGQSAGPWLHVYAGGGNQSMRFSDSFVVVDKLTA